MKILNKIEIRNFRGIKNIKFRPNSINIIVGANNSGKTAILEAISLFSSFPHNFEVVDVTNNMKNNMVEYLFKKYENYVFNINSNDLEVKGKLYNRTYKLNIKSINELKSKDKVEKQVIEHYLNKLSKFKKTLPKSMFLNISVENEDKSTSGKFGGEDYSLIKKHLLSELDKSIYDSKKHVISVHNSQGDIRILCSYIESDIFGIKNILNHANNDLSILLAFLPFSEMINKCDTITKFNSKGFKKYPVLFKLNGGLMNINYTKIEKLHDEIIEKKMDKDIDLIINSIKEKIYYIEDIRRTEEEIHVKVSGKYIPLSTMGDGFKELLRLAFVLSLADGGIVLLEEPETSLHPGFLDIIAELIVKSSENTQIFLTTHNLELLYKILEKSEELKKLDGVDIIRLYRKKRKPENVFIESIGGYDAKGRLDEIGEDLRW